MTGARADDALDRVHSVASYMELMPTTEELADETLN